MPRRKAVLLLVGAIAALVAFELALQVVAFVVWSSGRHDVGAGGDAPPERTVLCVGDSYTYGLGAETPDGAYPAQLAALLNADGGPSWSVVNGGWPGQPSRAVLLKIDEQLARHRPGTVCVLVGYNDSWGVPPEDLEVDAFPVVWRTGRLLALVGHWLTSEKVVIAPDPPVAHADDRAFVGQWHAAADGAELLIDPDGRFVLGGEEHRWNVHDGVLYVVLPAGPIGTDWAVVDGRLSLACGLWADQQWFEPGSAPAEYARLQAAWRAVRDGDAKSAATAFEQCLQDAKLMPSALEGLVTVHAADDSVSARRYLQRLESRYRADPDRPAFEALMRALQVLEAGDRALELACDYLGRTGTAPGAWPVIIDGSRRPETRAGVRAALLTALDVGVEVPDADRVRMLHALYGLDFIEDPVRATRWLLEASALDRSDNLLVRHIKSLGDRLTRDQFESMLTASAVAPDRQGWLREVYDRAVGTPGELVALTPHLRQIVGRCRAAGAEPVLLNYPVERPGVDRAVRTIRDELGVELVDVRAEFERVLQSRAAAELFAADGYHCNAAGYAIVARLVHEVIAGR